MDEDETPEEKKPAPNPKRSKMSKVINDVLGSNIDWTQLTERDLHVLYTVITDDRRLRKLAIRVLRKRLHGLGHQAKKEARGIVRDIITESGLGERALKLLAGDDEEDQDSDGLEGGE